MNPTKKNQKAVTEELLIDSLIDQPLFNPSYLNQKDLSAAESLPVSALIVTYNRSPSRTLELNPLYWAVDSLCRQKYSGLREIVIVDDGSADYTRETSHILRERTKLPIRYYPNKTNLGSPKSRNLALKEARESLIFFMDDDCVLAEYALFGLNQTYQKMAVHNRPGVIHPPVYYRSSRPGRLKPTREISQFSLEEAILTSSLDSFPLELAEAPDALEKAFLDDKHTILSPVPIVNLWGVFLADRKALELAGGFPAYFTWKNSYTEESELALRLLEQGFSSFYQFDPKFQAIHFRYGFQDNTFFRGSDWKKTQGGLTLREMSRLSNKNAAVSGNRVPAREWAETKITSFYVLFGLRSSAGAESWKGKTKKGFVDENKEEFYYYPNLLIEEPELREEIWGSGIRKGADLVELIKKQAMEEHFKGIAKMYREVRTTDEEPVRYIVSTLGGTKKTNFAEIGCGTGRYGLELLKQTPHASLTAIDFCKDMLKEARRHAVASCFDGRVKIMKALAEKLPLDDESVDHLLAFNAIHHFNLEKFLRESSRVLKKAGTLFLYTRTPQQNQENVWGRFFPDFNSKENRLYSAERLEKVISSAAHLAVKEVKLFSYPRRSSLEKLCAQARNKHYSTFQFYRPKEFLEALHHFEERLRQEFAEQVNIQWLDQNVLYVVSKN